MSICLSPTFCSMFIDSLQQFLVSILASSLKSSTILVQRYICRVKQTCKNFTQCIKVKAVIPVKKCHQHHCYRNCLQKIMSSVLTVQPLRKCKLYRFRIFRPNNSNRDERHQS